VLVPPLLAELRRQAPQVVARVRYGNVPSLLTLLTDEAIEFFVADRRMLVDPSRLTWWPWPRFAAACTSATATRCSCGERDDGGFDALRLGVVSTSRSSCLCRAGLGFASPDELPVVVECDDVTTLARLAADGDMLALLPRALPTAIELGLQPLRGVKTFGDLYVDAHAVWLRGRTLAPAAETAIRLFRQVADSGS